MGPTITPTPHSAIAEAWRSRGWLSSSTACDSGTRQAPNTPCSRRKATSCVRLCAAPHNIDAMVKPTTDHMNKRLRPSRADRYPVSSMKIAAATM